MLLSNLDLLATAPGGVARLRELILTLAVQGKLVPQDPADEPASVLLQRIRAEKDRLIAEGKIKRDKPLAEISEDEKPFELPQGWEWVRLPEIYYSISPSSNKLLSSAVEVEGLYPVVDQGQRPIAGYTNDQSLLIEIPGPVIVFGDHTKAIKHIDFDFVAGADGTKILRPVFQDEKFFAFQLRGFDLEDRGYARHFKVLNAQLYALPPLAEQSRIVTRVEELMRLCDALEAKGQLEATQHAQLVSTLLGTLTASATPEELAENWQRVAQHFDLLLNRPGAIDALEQTLLQLAVRGLLVPQDPTDEPASALLQRIRAEKDRLIATGQIKRDKPLPPITDEEKPFELPVGWEWVRLSALLQKIGAGSTPLGGREVYVPSGVKFLRSQNVWDEGLRLDGVAFIKPETHAKMAGTVVVANDLLFNITGASIGRCAVVPSDFDEANVSQHVTIIRAVLPELNAFLHKVLVSRHVQQTVMDVQVGVSREGLSIAKLGQFLIPVPPLAEQSRIVTRITALRRLCADLRQRLAERQSVQARLAEALVQEVSSV
ncbi:MAG: restriction endonuclease subunit S [Gammaproteobacteria bacterium]|nr:restriction endonuclease subunit S [Gammaproteobacteria bacterium]